MPSSKAPLWRCPKCGERFVTRNLWHSCGRHTLTEFFAGCDPPVLRLFRKFAAMVRSCGPVRVIPQKTRIVFQVRVRFGGVVRRKSYLLCSLALPKRRKHPRFLRIDTYAPNWHGHWFRVDSEKDLNADVGRWIRDAYAVGQQKHLKKRG